MAPIFSILKSQTFLSNGVMNIHRRLIHTSRLLCRKNGSRACSDAFRLKCGLEIHTQLKTKYKLFSLSRTSFNSSPNSNVSYFDCGLPGTMPKLNPEALLLALKAAVALNCDVQEVSTFDRKHYFYPDQPLGYQITQYYHPLALNGYLNLNRKFDDIEEEEKVINIERIQIEQDTGKTNYDAYDKTIKVDLNRANIPLIELVTKPDFESVVQVKAFVKKYQTLVKQLGICTGELETGAIRVDVNISVNGGDRVEIKNLGSSGEIVAALNFEFKRQVGVLKQGLEVQQETRGWDGSQTLRSRSKEDSVDYGYFSDLELPKIYLDSSISQDIKNSLPEFPQQMMERLTSAPYHLELKYARFLVDNEPIMQFYFDFFEIVVMQNHQSYKSANNWLIHEFLGALKKSQVEFHQSLVTPTKLADLVKLIHANEISNLSAKLLLMQMIATPQDNTLDVADLIEKYNLRKADNVPPEDLTSAVEEVCLDIIDENEAVVQKILNGKRNSIKFLIGLVMKETQGKVDSKLIEQQLIKLIDKRK